METRVAVLGIIVEDPDSVARLNEVLHENADIIIGRMGIGAIPGISVRAAYSK